MTKSTSVWLQTFVLAVVPLPASLRRLPEFTGIAGIVATLAITVAQWGERQVAFYGELRIDQMLMMRPFAGAAQYRMPVAGLYLCGAGAHPGGDISGLPGWNAAGQAIKDGGAQ